MALGTITEHASGKERLGDFRTYGYRYTLEADASGVVSGTALPVQPGFIYTVETIPSASSPPTEGYTLKVMNHRGVDLLAGEGAGMSSTAAQLIEGRPRPVTESVTPELSGAGNGGTVDVIFWIIGG